MKSHILPSLILSLCCLLLLAVLYPLASFAIGKITAPNAGNGEVIESKGRIIAYANLGQNFTTDGYFWSRPSAVNYNAAGSAGSNKGPSNPDYLQVVQARLDTFLVHNPGVRANQVPSELITASGSGLDPHLSPQAALIQVTRIAQVRQLNVRDLELLVEQHTEAPFLGLFGMSQVNVLKLNLALDQLSRI